MGIMHAFKRQVLYVQSAIKR